MGHFASSTFPAGIAAWRHLDVIMGVGAGSL
jgi:hypothetical protein